MILKIDTKNKENLIELLKSNNVEFEVLSNSDYINPYELLTAEIMEERNVPSHLKHDLFSKIVDATDEVGFEFGQE